MVEPKKYVTDVGIVGGVGLVTQFPKPRVTVKVKDILLTGTLDAYLSRTASTVQTLPYSEKSYVSTSNCAQLSRSWHLAE